MESDSNKKTKKSYSKKKKEMEKEVEVTPTTVVYKRDKKANAKKPTRKDSNTTTIEQIKFTLVDDLYIKPDILETLKNTIYKSVEDHIKKIEEPKEVEVEVESTSVDLEETPIEVKEEYVEEETSVEVKEESLVNEVEVESTPIDLEEDSVVEETSIEVEEDILEEKSIVECTPIDVEEDIDQAILFLDTPDQDYYIYSSREESSDTPEKDLLYKELVETNKILLNMGILFENRYSSLEKPISQDNPIKTNSSLPRDLVDKIYMSCPVLSKGQKSKLLLYGFSDFQEFIDDLKSLFNNVVILDSLEHIFNHIEKDDIALFVINSTDLSKTDFDKLINTNYDLVKNYILFGLNPKLYRTLVNYSNNFVLDFIATPGDTINNKKITLANDVYYITINKPDIVGKLFITADKVAFQFISNIRVKISNVYYVYRYLHQDNKDVIQLDNNKTIILDRCFTNLKYIDMENYKTISASL